MQNISEIENFLAIQTSFAVRKGLGKDAEGLSVCHLIVPS